MIDRLCGRVVHRDGAHLVIDVGGVGYGVEMPEPSARALASSDATVVVWVRTYVREDVIRLFAFSSLEERLLFDLLTAVNRVGPKNAMATLSTLKPAALIEAVQQERADILDDVPGVGAQLAKTIVLGLKPKIAKLIESGALSTTARPALTWIEGASTPQQAGLAPGLLADLKTTLENLGYKEREYAPLLREIEQTVPARDFQGLVKYAVSALSGKARLQARITEADALDEVF